MKQATADILALAGQEPKFINNLLGALGRTNLALLCLRGHSPHQQPVIDFLSETFRQKSLTEWESYLETLDVCFGRVNTPPEALKHQYLDARKMIRHDERGRRHIAPPIRFRQEPASPVLREPRLGEHTETIFDAKTKPFGE